MTYNDVRLVTPNLYLGHPDLPDVVDVTTPEEAVDAIQQDKIAALPRDGIDLVEPILEELGASPEHIETRLDVARHGNLTR